MDRIVIMFALVAYLVSCQSTTKQEGQSLVMDYGTVVTELETTQKEEVETILNKRLKVFMPSGFTLMDKASLNTRYPMEGRRPTEVFTNSEGTINIAFNHTQTFAGITDLPQFKRVFEQQFNRPGINFKNSEIKTINGTEFIILEFVTPSPGEDVYNRIFITSLENRLLMGTFNCSISLLQEWQPIADSIINSLEVLK